MPDLFTRRHHWIDDTWTVPAVEAEIELVDPTTEQRLGAAPAGTAADVDRAVQVAARAFESWSRTSVIERQEILRRFAEGMDARGQELADVITAEVGAPVNIALPAQVGFPLNVLRSHVDILDDFSFTDEIANSLILKEAVGVVGAISPWNFPIQLVMAKLAPALAAGCTVVLKPSEYTPLTAYVLAEILHDAGLPPGVFNIVAGTGPVVGEALSRHPLVNMVSMTGSTRAGKQVFAAASQTIKRMHLELGGKSASVVLEGAELEKAVRTSIDQAFFNSGQACLAWSRLLVPEHLKGEVEGIAKDQAESYVSGDPRDPGTHLGPQQNLACFERVQDYISSTQQTSARLVTGGTGRPDGIDAGYFVRPTVFSDVKVGDRIAQEEVFGPVVSIMPYRDADDAAEIANATDFGLHGAVWGADDEVAVDFARRVRSGRMDINGAQTNLVSPFGGYKQSGFGRELGRYGLEAYLEIKSLQVRGDDTGGLAAGIRVKEPQG